MDSLGKFAPSDMAGMAQVQQPRQMTVTENLEIRRQRLQEQLDRVDAALAALKANPEVERTLNLIQQASY